MEGIIIEIDNSSCGLKLSTQVRWKRGFAVNMVAFIDSNYWFFVYSTVTVALTHDWFVCKVPDLTKLIRKCKVPQLYWICGNYAYACSEQLITPFSRADLKNIYKDAFNFFQSSMQVYIEQYFGVHNGSGEFWVQRWNSTSPIFMILYTELLNAVGRVDLHMYRAERMRRHFRWGYEFISLVDMKGFDLISE